MKKILLTLVVALSMVAPAWAQTYLTTTTTSAAISAGVVPGQTIVVASATDIEVNGSLFIDHELMGVSAVSGTRITVSRTFNPTAHVSGSRVIVAKASQKAAVFLAHEATVRLVGACTASQQNFLPKVDTVLGNVYLCRDTSTNGTGAQWTYTNIQGLNGAGSLLYNLSSVMWQGMERLASLRRTWADAF